MRYREVRDETKFHRMSAFGASLRKIREQVNRDLSITGLPQRKVVAALVRLLDETYIRIGNQEYARENQSFGLTTLRDRHASVRGEMLHFRFQGKSNQEHDITLRDRRLARVAKSCQDLPGQDLFQYQLENGESIKVTSSDVNEYLRKVSQQDFTAKDFRTWHGTGQMARQLAPCGPVASEREIKRNIVEAVKRTAKRLGNRPAACPKYYIHPAVLASYAEQTIFAAIPKPALNAAAARNKLSLLERAVLRLVRSYASPRQAKAS